VTAHLGDLVENARHLLLEFRVRAGAAPSHEAAAPALGRPFSTYRRYLAKALDEVTDLLRAIEIGEVRRGGRRMTYELLVTLILVLHFAFLAYVVFGGFLAWRWPRTIWLHGAAAAWGVILITAQLNCPLTVAEDWARQRAGQAGLTRGFIDRYVEGVLYPERYAGLMQGLAAVTVLVSWIGFFVLIRRKRPSVAAR
jgi:Protein of Unknown function (DUF2784)